MKLLLILAMTLIGQTLFAKVMCISEFDNVAESCQIVLEKEAQKKCDDLQIGTTAYSCKEFQNNCSKYQFENSQASEYDIFAPDSQTINNTDYPRIGRMLYRGVAKDINQFNTEKVIRAYLGDTTHNIGSKLHFYITQVLQRKERLSSYFSLFKKHQIFEEVRDLLKCNHAYTDYIANKYARDLGIKSFNRMLENRENKDGSDYVKYRTSSFVSQAKYMESAGHIFSSLYPRLAQSYGSKVLLFKNQSNKNLDMNYWNYMNNNSLWSYHNADVGEFVTNSAIEPSSIRGIWFTTMDGRKRSKERNTSMKGNRITKAFMGTEIEGEKYIAVLDTKQLPTYCIVENEGKFYSCSYSFRPRKWKQSYTQNQSDIEFGPVKARGREIPIIALIKACPADVDCQFSTKEILKDHAKSKVILDKEVIEKLSSIVFSIGDIPYKTHIEFSESKNIRIVSANIIPKKSQRKQVSFKHYISNYCRNKRKCEFKISEKFAQYQLPEEEVMNVEVKYTCGNNPSENIVGINANMQYLGQFIDLHCR